VIPALALVAGVALGLVFEPVVPLWLQPYLPIAVVAALDAMFGGIRARLDGIFDARCSSCRSCRTCSWRR
jgi:small basic protein